MTKSRLTIENANEFLAEKNRDAETGKTSLIDAHNTHSADSESQQSSEYVAELASDECSSSILVL
jgi:hypothetical protein